MVCKEACLLVTLHDMNNPYVDLKYFPHIYYLDPHLAPLLYLRYRIDEKDLWECIFTKIINNEEDELIRELRSIEVYRWDEIRDMLNRIAVNLLSLHEKKCDDFLSLSSKIFGFKSSLKKSMLC